MFSIGSSGAVAPESKMKRKKEAGIKPSEDSVGADNKAALSVSQTPGNVYPIVKRSEPGEEASAKLVNGIINRCASDATMAFFAFLHKSGGLKLIPVPEPANLLKIGRHFSSLPGGVQAAISSSIPEKEREATNTLIELLESQSKASVDSQEQPKLEYDEECSKGSAESGK